MPKRIDIAAVEPVVGTSYPPPYDKPCRARERRRLGDAAGLTQFGVNLLRLPPGAWSSQRHWQTKEDEFVYVLSGEVFLVTDSGEETMRPAMPPGSKPTTRTGIAFKTAATVRRSCWRSALAFRVMARTILIST